MGKERLCGGREGRENGLVMIDIPWNFNSDIPEKDGTYLVQLRISYGDSSQVKIETWHRMRVQNSAGGHSFLDQVAGHFAFDYIGPEDRIVAWAGPIEPTKFNSEE